MNRDKDYLEHILECIERILRYTASGQEAFYGAEMAQDAVERNFEIIGEAAKRLSAEIKQTQATIPWRRIAGFRDVLIHDYEDIDLDEVWTIIVRDLPPLKVAVEAMLKSVESDDDRTG